jgi:hypothetical protein
LTHTSRNIAAALLNSARNIAELFPGYFGQLKHNYKKDFGWPEHVGFKNFFGMYQRNGLAKAAVHKTATKTWEDWPKLVNDSSDRNNDSEKAVMRHLRKLRAWQKMAEADRRAMVGGYSALILRFADGRKPEQPVGPLTGIVSLVEIVPAWAEQIVVSEWDTDVMSETYGQPKMFQFNEMELSENRQINGKVRSFMVHPSRVVIWSSDGTVYGRSLLEAGYNDLIDMEKIKGAGGEGFWKNAKAAPVLEVDKDANLREMATAMGVEEDGILEAMNKQVENYSKGFDNVLMVQGIQAKPMNVQLSVPESFFMVALMSYAASVEMPLKILVGSQSGERASTEDAREWAQTTNARRVNFVMPLIEAFIERLVEANVLVGDWAVSWSDLTKATLAEKLELAIKMAAINQKADVKKIGEVVFTKAEIRQAVDYAAEPEGGFPEVDDTEDETELPDEGLEETQKVEVE